MEIMKFSLSDKMCKRNSTEVFWHDETEIYFSRLMYHLMYVLTTNLWEKFQIICALRFSRIIIQIVKKLPKMKAFKHISRRSGWEKHKKIDFQFISKYISSLSVHIFLYQVPRLISVEIQMLCFRLLNLNGVSPFKLLVHIEVIQFITIWKKEALMQTASNIGGAVLRIFYIQDWHYTTKYSQK